MSAMAKAAADRGGPAQALQRHPARRGREGPSRRARDLLPGVRQGHHGRRQRTPHRFQEHADHPDHQCRHRHDHGAVARSEISRRAGGAGAQLLRPDLLKVFPAALLGPHRHNPLFSALGRMLGGIVRLQLDRIGTPHPRQSRRRLRL